MLYECDRYLKYLFYVEAQVAVSDSACVSTYLSAVMGALSGLFNCLKLAENSLRRLHGSYSKIGVEKRTHFHSLSHTDKL